MIIPYRLEGTKIYFIGFDPIEVNKLLILKQGEDEWLAKVVKNRIENISNGEINFIIREWFKEETEEVFFNYYVVNEAVIVAKIKKVNGIPISFERPRKIPKLQNLQIKELDESYSSLFKKDLPVGKLKDTNIIVEIPKSAFNRHFAIFGMTGSGKTNLASCIISEALRNMDANVIVIDAHADLSKKIAKFVIKNRYDDRVTLLSSDGSLPNSAPLKINPNDFTPSLFLRVFNLSEAQEALLFKFYNSSRENWVEKLLNFEEGKSDIELNTQEKLSHNAIVRRLKPILDEKIFSFEASSFNKELYKVCNGVGSLIIDISSILNEKVELLLANYIASKIFYFRQKKRKEFDTHEEFIKNSKPVWLVIEEAHRLLANNELFVNFVKEARKNNTSLFFIEQDPSGIDKDLLKQIGTKFLLLLIHKEEIETIKNATGIETSEEISQMEKGDCQLICEVENGYVFAVPLKTSRFEDEYLK